MSYRSKSDLKAAAEGEMPFLDHLEELRWRMIWSLSFIVVGAAIGLALVFKAQVIALLLLPLNNAIAEAATQGAVSSDPVPGGVRLTYLSLTEHFFFMVKVGVGTGLLLVSPIIIYQIWAFLSPALKSNEKRIIIPSLYFGLILFLSGGAVAYFVALPASIRFLLSFGSDYFTPMLTAAHYLSFVLGLLLAFGILFEMPVVILILTALNLITPKFLREKRRHAYLLLTITSAVVSPGDVIFVTLMLLVPLIILYEVSVSLATLIYNRTAVDNSRESLLDPLMLWIILGRMAKERVRPSYGA